MFTKSKTDTGSTRIDSELLVGDVLVLVKHGHVIVLRNDEPVCWNHGGMLSRLSVRCRQFRDFCADLADAAGGLSIDEVVGLDSLAYKLIDPDN